MRPFAVLGLVAASVFLGTLASAGVSATWALVILGGVLAFLPFGFAALRGRIDVFEPIYLFSLCYGVLFVVRPAFDLANAGGQTLWLGYSVTSGYEAALMIGLVGALCFYVGYAMPLGLKIARRLPIPLGRWAKSSLTVVVLMVALVSGLFFAAYVLTNGGLGAVGSLLAGRSATSRVALTTSSGYLYTAPLWLGSLGLLILATSRRWFSVAGLLGFALICSSQIEAIVYGDRSWWLPMAASVALIYYLRRRRRPSAPVLCVAALIVLIFGLTVPRMYREVDARTQSFAATVGEAAADPFASIYSLFQGLDTAMIDGLAVEVEYVPGAIHYQYGATYVEALGRPIPRTLWTSKPPEAENLLMQELLPDFARRHITFYFSVFGEPYLNFGVVGVVLFALLFGAGWRLIYEWLQRQPDNPNLFAIYAASWPFLFVYMRGGVGVDYQRQVIIVLPMVVAMTIALVHRPAPAPSHLMDRAQMLSSSLGGG